MAKIIRLTERDLTRLVKRVIREEDLKDQPKDIKDFQNFMDWFDSTWYKGGKLKRGPGYGTFGPYTQTAWSKYKKDYEEYKEAMKNAFDRMNKEESEKFWDEMWKKIPKIEN